MNKNTIKLVIKTTIITLVVLAVVGYSITKCDFFTNVGKMDAKIVNFDCNTENTTVNYILWNFSDERIDFYRVVLTATDKNTGEETPYQVKEYSGLLGKERLEKRMIIGRFDCSKYDFKIAVYHF